MISARGKRIYKNLAGLTTKIGNKKAAPSGAAFSKREQARVVREVRHSGGKK